MTSLHDVAKKAVKVCKWRERVGIVERNLEGYICDD
jgi:hypothetical protein